MFDTIIAFLTIVILTFGMFHMVRLSYRKFDKCMYLLMFSLSIVVVFIGGILKLH